MKRLRSSRTRWRLADLLDFESLLARKESIDKHERLMFARDIQPQLTNLSEIQRRSRGLYQWLDQHRHRDQGTIWPGQAWRRVTDLARWGLLGGFALMGAVLVWGLSLGNDQRMHVVIFIGLTVVLPWIGFMLISLWRRLVGRRAGETVRPLQWLIKPLMTRLIGQDSLANWQRLLADSNAARQASRAQASRLMQWGGLGFSLGVVAAFITSLMLFDVHFYWEATLDNTALMSRIVDGIAIPWAALWPEAVPSHSLVEATRSSVAAGQASVDHTSHWWRFLMMTVLVWGALPRLLLVLFYGWRERRVLARLDFQAPRHRKLWRALAGVVRQPVTQADSDEALVLDVGGHGIDGKQVRGFMLRRLRLNPEQTQRVGVLDDAAEAAADQALAREPGHVVLIAPDWSLSPRAADRLHRRVRTAVGQTTPMTWLIVADDNGQPDAPEADAIQRWTRFIDDQRDPAMEIAAYDPGA